MTKQTIHFDQFRFNMHLAKFENALPLFSEVVDKYNEFQLAVLEPNEFELLFLNTVDVLFDKITYGQPVYAGEFLVDKAKAIDLIAKPAGYHEFLQFVSEVKEKLMRMIATMNTVNIFKLTDLIKCYECVDCINVKIKESVVTRLRNENSSYIESERQEKIIVFVNKVKSLLEEDEVWQKICLSRQPTSQLQDFLKNMLTNTTTGISLNTSYLRNFK